jgi:hypothetical protein
MKLNPGFSHTVVNRDIAISNQLLSLGAGELEALLSHILIKTNPRLIHHIAKDLGSWYRPHPL